MSKDLFVVNPPASGGRGLVAWERFREEWPDELDPADVVLTTHVGHATEAVAAAEGYDRIVAVGGDATVNEIRGSRPRWTRILPGLLLDSATPRPAGVSTLPFC